MILLQILLQGQIHVALLQATNTLEHLGGKEYLRTVSWKRNKNGRLILVGILGK
jgi:hypothetical protein